MVESTPSSPKRVPHPRASDSGDESATLFEGTNEKPQPTNLTYNRQARSLDGSTVVDGNENVKTEGNLGSFQFGQNGDNKRVLSHSRIAQDLYNDNKTQLDRLINTATQIILDIQKENAARPVYYPTDIDFDSGDAKLNSNKSRIAMIRQNSVVSTKKLLKEPAVEKDDENGYTFELLKINLKLGPGSAGIVQNLDKSAMSQLLSEKFSHISKHLGSIKERIDDTSSKVLVTGDLNSGKSAFCNALLKRNVMPEDQQPCTNVFCEIIDARDNNGKEEVHAIPIGQSYKMKDERTYEVFKLDELEDLVYESEKYSLLIVYVNENRSQERSLLKNGVIDVKLIDAPGLNLDSYHTTQVFSRQEEIDLVVFVVNAENHFTLSGREFISNATNDKNLMFIVVNKFDNIKNKKRCQRSITDQIKSLSPDIYDNAGEFVHFVSSKEVLDKLPDGDDGGDGPGGDPDHDHDYSSPEFDHLESNLRNYLLEKRSMSKLLPAKNYLVKLFSDLVGLSQVNLQMYEKEKNRMLGELNAITPVYDQLKKASFDVSESITKVIDKSASDSYDYSKELINQTIENVDQVPLGVEFNGYSNITKFVIETQQRIYDVILGSVTQSEDYARSKTAAAVVDIKQLGKEVLGDGVLPQTTFLPEKMYSKQKDMLQRHLETNFSIMDFVDPNMESFCKEFGINLPNHQTNLAIGLMTSRLWKTGATGLILLYGPQLISLTTGVFSVSRAVPGVIYKKIVPVALLATAIGVPAYYFYKDAPHAFQRNVVKKIKARLESDDYQHKNSARISKEVRKVLNHPSKDIMNKMSIKVEDQNIKRSKILKELANSEESVNFYKILDRKSQDQKLSVCEINL